LAELLLPLLGYTFCLTVLSPRGCPETESPAAAPIPLPTGLIYPTAIG